MKASVKARVGSLAVSLLLVSSYGCAQADTTAQVTVHADHPGAVIHPEIYGQFAEQLGRGR